MFETAIPGAGYGYGALQAGLPVPGALGQPPFGGQVGGLGGTMAQRFGGYPVPQWPGAIPFQQIQPQFGQPQFGQPQFGQPQFGQPQFGQPQFGQPQFGQAQFGQPQVWQPQFGGQQLGMTQPQVQLIPVVTPQGLIGLLLLATGQPLAIGTTAGGIFAGLSQFGGQVGGLGGGYLPLQLQQQIPQQVPQLYGPGVPIAGPSFPGQPLGAMPLH